MGFDLSEFGADWDNEYTTPVTQPEIEIVKATRTRADDILRETPPSMSSDPRRLCYTCLGRLSATAFKSEGGFFVCDRCQREIGL